MSIEAVALSRLMADLENIVDGATERTKAEITKALVKANFYVQPLKEHMTVAADMLRDNPMWDYHALLTGLGALDNDLTVMAVVAGDMNYQVENDGFIGWWFNGYAAPSAVWILLSELLTAVNTPVGVQVRAIVTGVKLCVEGKVCGNLGSAEYALLEQRLRAFTEAYRLIRNNWLIDLETYLRRSK